MGSCVIYESELMPTFIQGYQDKMGKIHPSFDEATKADMNYYLHQDMYGMTRSRIPIIKWPSADETAEYVIRNYDQSKLIMERYGR